MEGPAAGQTAAVTVKAVATGHGTIVRSGSTAQVAGEQAVVGAAAATGSELQAQEVHVGSETEPVHDSQHDSQAPAATADVQAPETLASKLSHLIACQQQRDRSNAVRDGPRLRSLAAQVLCIVCRSASVRPPGSLRRSRRAPAHSSMAALAEAMGMEAGELAQHVSSVAGRHHLLAHPRSATLAELDAEVAAVRQLITAEHEQRYSWECLLIRHYEDFKAAYVQQRERRKRHHPDSARQHLA